MSENTDTVPMGRPAPPGQLVSLARGALVGRYVVLDLLGSGGMGVVYSAYDPELDRQVVLKLLRPDRVQEDSRLRLLREAQAVARLSLALDGRDREALSQHLQALAVRERALGADHPRTPSR